MKTEGIVVSDIIKSLCFSWISGFESAWGQTLGFQTPGKKGTSMILCKLSQIWKRRRWWNINILKPKGSRLHFWQILKPFFCDDKLIHRLRGDMGTGLLCCISIYRFIPTLFFLKYLFMHHLPGPQITPVESPREYYPQISQINAD